MKSGIYIIENLVNDKIYIGSATTEETKKLQSEIRKAYYERKRLSNLI